MKAKEGVKKILRCPFNWTVGLELHLYPFPQNALEMDSIPAQETWEIISKTYSFPHFSF